MKCKYLKLRSKKGIRYYYCSLLKKEIQVTNCYSCTKKEYKEYKTLNKRSKKLNKAEKERFSIIYHSFDKCAECGLKSPKIAIDKNEVFEGAYRQTSIKYGMVVPLCRSCHQKFDIDRVMNLKYKDMFQREFMKNHSLEEFLDLFKKDYSYLYKQKKD